MFSTALPRIRVVVMSGHASFAPEPTAGLLGIQQIRAICDRRHWQSGERSAGRNKKKKRNMLINFIAECLHTMVWQHDAHLGAVWDRPLRTDTCANDARRHGEQGKNRKSNFTRPYEICSLIFLQIRAQHVALMKKTWSGVPPLAR